MIVNTNYVDPNAGGGGSSLNCTSKTVRQTHLK